MSEPGEYTGADGKLYAWDKSVAGGYLPVFAEGGEFAEIAPADWPAAKAALDALIEAEEGEWVEIDKYRRVSPDGAKAQHRLVNYRGNFIKGWTDRNPHGVIFDAYRAGLTTGKKDAQELAEAVLDKEYPGMNLVQQWDRIRALAKRVKS